MRSFTAATLLALAGSAIAAPAAEVKTVTVTVTATAPCSTTSAATTTSVDTQEYPTATATATSRGKRGLDDYARAAGKKYFGTAADIPGPEQMDHAYMAELNNTQVRDWGQLTPANYMKWEFTEPTRGEFNFTGADEFVAIAHANRQLIRCHNTVWYNQLPDWLTSQTWDNATLISIMENHITHLIKHFGSSCLQWDVVNEAINDNGTLRSDLFLDTIGPAYIPIAFRAAAKAAPPGVALFYNDYNIEYPGPKATAAQQLVKELKSQGLRIDGVGLQSHFIVGQTPSQADQESNMAAFTALGVDVAITELDVRMPTLPANLSMQEQQKKDYYSSVAACTNTPRCVGITVWDFDDEYSWIPSTFPGQGYGDLFLETNSTHPKLVAKSAYDGVVDALTHRPVDRRDEMRWSD